METNYKSKLISIFCYTTFKVIAKTNNWCNNDKLISTFCYITFKVAAKTNNCCIDNKSSCHITFSV